MSTPTRDELAEQIAAPASTPTSDVPESAGLVAAESEGATIEDPAVRPPAREPLDDPRSAYFNARTCQCGGDANEHPCPHPEYDHGFDPDWEHVRELLERAAVQPPAEPQS